MPQEGAYAQTLQFRTYCRRHRAAAPSTTSAQAVSSHVLPRQQHGGGSGARGVSTSRTRLHWHRAAGQARRSGCQQQDLRRAHNACTRPPPCPSTVFCQSTFLTLMACADSCLIAHSYCYFALCVHTSVHPRVAFGHSKRSSICSGFHRRSSHSSARYLVLLFLAGGLASSM